jgi:phosphoribosyl 1,2-cyclic phosphodiesterase
MRVRLWGTRGSVAAPGPETVRYGGNTACVEVRGKGGELLVLDAGTGITRLGRSLGMGNREAHILLTHLHMDHIQGLGFFTLLFDPGAVVHVWGPPSIGLHLRDRLTRYLSPPLFPVRLRDLPCTLAIHNILEDEVVIGGLRVRAALVTHPGPTVGYRIGEGANTLAYLPDHEPALGVRDFPQAPEWTSGHEIAEGVDLLIHDAQYTGEEYPVHAGWGHSSLEQALAFARLAGAKRLVTFHHDPAHSDDEIDAMCLAAGEGPPLPFTLIPGREGAVFEV